MQVRIHIGHASMPEHPKRRFHDLLDDLQALILEMAGEAESFLGRATDALLARDGAEARRIRADDEVIDQIELEVDERALELLALQQPMARDLRQIVATLKVANDLERVGDHAVKICNATRTLTDFPPVPDLPQLEEMVGMTRDMLADSLKAFTARDGDLAREVRVRDDQVDRFRDALNRLLVSHMLEDPRRITPALELILVSQSLERVADLATNIGEETVFLAEGTVIRHTPEEPPA